MIVTYLDVQPHEVPARMPSPFGPPHALAQRAAAQLRDELRTDRFGLSRDGKMFGVLVVADGERIGFVRAFSGMVDGTWHVDGFAPPVFDAKARDAFWPAGERELDDVAAALDELAARIAPARAAVVAHATATLALRERHRERRAQRHAERAQTGTSHALDQQSRGDAAERRKHIAAGAPLVAALQTLEAEHRALATQRAQQSRELLQRIFATYAMTNASGEVRALRDVFAPAEPPGGAGDCAAPKLLAHAYRHGLRPVALAELWIGAPPLTGGRHDGLFYPPCRGKCEPVLRHMLAGLDVEPPPALTIATAELHTIYEDDWLVVVAKPPGLLSVPGKLERDSVQTRLRARDPAITLVHRLDLDVSGVLVAAKDPRTHSALQAQFADRTVAKRYIAWLDGEVPGDGGTIDLPLRVDLDDRPRQLVDRVHGRPAVTEWRVLAREPRRTRVALFPQTGRAHQLRVHAACGIGVPIVGDRLYGRANSRLLLHAEAIGFVHPKTQLRVDFSQAAPF